MGQGWDFPWLPRKEVTAHVCGEVRISSRNRAADVENPFHGSDCLAIV